MTGGSPTTLAKVTQLDALPRNVITAWSSTPAGAAAGNSPRTFEVQGGATQAGADEADSVSLDREALRERRDSHSESTCEGGLPVAVRRPPGGRVPQSVLDHADSCIAYPSATTTSNGKPASAVTTNA